MKAPLLLLALAAAPPALAQTTADDDNRTIVVTAKRADATANALKACIARACPPDQEVAAALAHAENQFIDGDYREARRTLLATIGRVDRQAKAYPVPVANIWRAESRIAAHLGERNAMQGGQFQAIDALKAGLDRADLRVLAQRLEVADAFAKQGKIEMARSGYRKVAGQARDLNAPTLIGAALLRVAILDATIAALPNGLGDDPQRPIASAAANIAQARASVAAVRALDGPDYANFRDAADLIEARLDAQRGDMSGIDRLVARYATAKPARTMLLYAPRMEDKGTIFELNRLPGETADSDFIGQWADVTFLIGADGRVRDVEVLRESPKMRGNWTAPVLAMIGKRRYAPIDVPEGTDGVRRVERYTMTAYKTVPTGSRMTSRSAPRLEMLDLTADTADARPATSGASAPSPAE